MFLTPVKAQTVFNDSLNYADDHQWYSVHISSGQTINLALSVPAGTDLDLYLSSSGCMHKDEYNNNVPSDLLKSS